MKNYLLTKDLLLELLKGSKPQKEKIFLKLEDLLQKNKALFISMDTLNKILDNEPDIEKRTTIYQNIKALCEKILSLDNDDLPLVLGFQNQFRINHETAIELLIAQKHEMDCILDISQKFQFQKIISVTSLILKGE